MKLLDVNILVEAHRADAPRHDLLNEWLLRELKTYSGVGVSELAMSGLALIVDSAAMRGFVGGIRWSDCGAFGSMRGASGYLKEAAYEMKLPLRLARV